MNKKLLKTLTIFLITSFVVASPALANNPPDLPEVFPIIYKAVKIFFGLIAIITAAMVVKGAYMWMVSGGDPQRIKLAQGTLTWAIVGLIFFIMAPFLFDVILRLLGVELPTPDVPGLDLF